MVRLVTESDVGYIHKLANENKINEVAVTATENYDKYWPINLILEFPSPVYGYASKSIVNFWRVHSTRF